MEAPRRTLAVLLCAVVAAHAGLLSAWPRPPGASIHQQAQTLNVTHIQALSALSSPAQRPPASGTSQPPRSRAHGADRALTASALEPTDLQLSYLRNDVLDRRSMPRSAPDEGALRALAWSGLPMRLRLFVSARGVVTEVQALQVSPQDVGAIEQLTRIFKDTAFIPGRIAGIDVAAYLDIEFGAPEPIIALGLSNAEAEPLVVH